MSATPVEISFTTDDLRALMVNGKHGNLVRHLTTQHKTNDAQKTPRPASTTITTSPHLASASDAGDAGDVCTTTARLASMILHASGFGPEFQSETYVSLVSSCLHAVQRIDAWLKQPPL